MFVPAVKRTLKALRASEPINHAATSVVKTLLGPSARSSEFVIRHLHRVGPVETRLPNGKTLKLWSRGDDWVSNQIYWRGWDGYDGETVPLWFRLAQRASTILDVGAYVGYYSLLAALANPRASVHAFEPLPAIHKRLERLAALNGLTNIRAHCLAVSDAGGSAEFFHTDAEMPTSSSLSAEFMAGAAGVVRSIVPVTRLDGFLQEHGIARVDLMKIDTESTEPAVLRGMGGVLERDGPTIVCEVLGRGSEKGLEAVLGPLGYRYYLLTGAGPEPREEISAHQDWLNYLFTPLPPEEVAGL